MKNGSEGSPRFKLDGKDASTAVKIAFVLGVGAAAEFLVKYASEQDYGIWTAAAVAAFGAAGTVITRWVRNNAKAVEK